ncbi:GNAT family N-acetyltransferase [Pseudooceanicola sp.]|uniref:GNAT family N-acetyltransferase n=1 Tax=Pseudooceanicola sp. TaxID=1914328 RepID=UPI0035C6AFF9
MSLTIVPGVPDRLPDMARLLSSALQREIPLRRLRRKYLSDGDAGRGQAHLLIDGGRAVGVAGYTLCRYVLPDGAVVTAAQYGDFALLPEYRGTGVFGDLCQNIHQTICERGAAFSFALTSEGSRAVMTRALNHQPMQDLHCFDIPLTSRSHLPVRVLDRARRSFGWRGAAVERAPSAFRTADSGHAERGDRFVSARRVAGIRFLEIEGHDVMIRPGSVSNVALPGDIDPAAVPGVLDALGRRARRAGTRVLRLMLTNDEPAFAHVDRIAGPAPGQLTYCARDISTGLDMARLRFGFADYENF